MNIEIFPKSDLDFFVLLVITNQMIYFQQCLMDTRSKVLVQVGKEIEPKKLGLFFLVFFLKSFYPLQNIRVPRHLPKGRCFIDQLAITVPTVLPLISVVVTILLEYTAEGTDKHQ